MLQNYPVVPPRVFSLISKGMQQVRRAVSKG